jgi:hypothetical protein
MLFGTDDPHPWTAGDSLARSPPERHEDRLRAPGRASRAERPADTRQMTIDAMRRPAKHGR